MPIGLILSLFTFITMATITILNNKTKKLFSSYWFYSITSLIFLVYFIIFRWSKDLTSWINNDDRNIVGGMETIMSKVLLLDLCPFNFIVLSFSLIVSKNRTLPSVISFLGIFGGLITIYGQIMFEGVYSNNVNLDWVIIRNLNWWQYTFLNDCYFFSHFYLLVMSYIVLLNTKSFNLKKIIYSHIYPIGFFTYITTMSFSMNITWNVTGIRPNDWSDLGEYAVLGKMLPFPWPIQPIVVFIFVAILINAFIQIRNIMVLDKRYITYDIFVPRVWKSNYIKFIEKNWIVVK